MQMTVARFSFPLPLVGRAGVEVWDWCNARKHLKPQRNPHP